MQKKYLSFNFISFSCIVVKWKKKFDDDCNCGSFLSDFINFTFYQKNKNEEKTESRTVKLRT